MTHTPPLEVRSDQPPLPNQPFSPWLRGQTTLFISQISAILGLVLFLASLVYYVTHFDHADRFLQPGTVRLIVDYAHIIFIAVFITVLIQVLDDNKRGRYRVKLVYDRVFPLEQELSSRRRRRRRRCRRRRKFKRDLDACEAQLGKFKRRFLWFWIGMLILYVCFACQHSYKAAIEKIPDPGESQRTPFSGVVTRKNNTPEQYSVDGSFGAPKDKKVEPPPYPKDLRDLKDAVKHVAPPAFPRPLLGLKGIVKNVAPPAPKPLEGWQAFKHLVFPFIVFSLNTITLGFVFLCFLILYIPAREMTRRYPKYRNATIVIVISLIALCLGFGWFRVGVYTYAEWDHYSAIFDALSGVLNAIALALMIARLDSKLIGLPSWLTSILYSYAAVQPLFIVFELSESEVLKQIATFVLIFVFVSKVYFFLIILYAMQTGRMLNYLFCFPILRDRVYAAALENGETATSSVSAEKKSQLMRDQRTKGRSQFASAPLERGPLVTISKWLGLGTIAGFFGYLIYASRLLKDRDALQTDTDIALLIVWIQPVLILVGIGTLLCMWGPNKYGLKQGAAMAERTFKGLSEAGYSIKEDEKQLTRWRAYFLYFLIATFVLHVVFLFNHLDFRVCVNEGRLGISLFAETIPCGVPSLLSGPIGGLLAVLSYPFLEFSLGTVNSLFIFWCFVILRSPAFHKDHEIRDKLLKRQGVWINYSSFVVCLLIACYPLLLFLSGVMKNSAPELQNYATVFNGVTGTLSAVVLALLIARMDSRFFGQSLWVLALLFAYASIQPLFVAFALNVRVLAIVQTSVLAAALGLKICFFLIIVHSLRSGRLVNYLLCFPFLKDRVDSIFENQFEVRLVPSGDEADPFTILILKKNELRYSSSKRFRSREKCDKFVHYLRERMEEGYFKTESESGTHWVELRSNKFTPDKSEEVICESLPLRSKEEADELIRESRDKIPHCKYNRA